MTPRGRLPAGSARRGLALTALVAAAWVLLAVLRPTVTYHLAPALVALALPYAYWSRSERRSLRGAVLTALAGGVLAAGVTVGLGTAGLLEGPVLFGGDAVGEGLIVAGSASAAAAALGAGWVMVTSRTQDAEA